MGKIASWPCFSTAQLVPRLCSRGLLRGSSRRSRAEPLCCLPAAAAPAAAAPAAAAPARIVCVGDIHGQWGAGDERALAALAPDVVLFVGDYGNEDLRVTGRIAALAGRAPFAVATVFGNHDAFFTASERGRANAPYDRSATCRVTEQKRLLAPYDVAYQARALGAAGAGASVVGGRQWSWGGPHWKHGEFYRVFEGVAGIEQSTARIVAAVEQARSDAVLFLSHSGPTGLGDRMTDPCGRDWGAKPGGDHGDADLRAGIEFARKRGIRVPLVVFGHMHRSLSRNRGVRTMLVSERDGDSGGCTIMLNAAVVPRHRSDPRAQRRMHNFQLVELTHEGVRSVKDLWVAADGTECVANVLYDRDHVLDKASVG